MKQKDDAPGTPVTPSLEQLMAQLVALQQQQTNANVLAEERSRPRENPLYKPSGAFYQASGEPWAHALKCGIFLGPSDLRKHPLTEAEVTALNQLEPVEKATIERTDGSRVIAKVTATRDAQDRIEKLTIDLPMSKDDTPNAYPKLVELANQIAAQIPVAA